MAHSWTCVPASTMDPWSMTMILWALRTVCRRWAMTTTVCFPCEACMTPSRVSCTRASLSASSALVASSSSRMDGLRSSARAITTRCFCPPLSVPLLRWVE
mmetsp:Transcript_40430/g.114497  ORF Transcript_40430/g.114497 Transcript_40430/m.114497 type:complete len:101 (-) Transcript_40430:2094-2396(-)